MKERLIRQLHPEVHQALRLAKQLSGKEPVIRGVPHLPLDTRARLIRPKFPTRPYEIEYDRRQERTVEHLIVHEIGHIVRVHQVPDEERLAPARTQEGRRQAATQIANEVLPILALGLPEEALVQAFNAWLDGTCTQLANFPADLRIEQWIYDRFPGLRPVQRRSLLSDVERALPLLHPDIRRTTPPTIYRATMAMNAAQAYHVNQLYPTDGLTEPFERHGFAQIASYLIDLVFAAPDQGHRSDMEAVNLWAQELRLTGWFRWQPYHGSR